ncbi:heavy metal transporter [Microbacterium aureliae]
MSDDVEPVRRARERVVIVRAPRTPSPARTGLAGSPAQEADAVYARGLMRTQLRLALAHVIAFVVVAGTLAVALAIVPELDRVLVAGVPLSWLLHAYGFYPIVAVFAATYVRAAARNEQRYRALRERE